MKYICTKSEDDKTEIFTFPNTINHDDMMEAICLIKKSSFNNWERILRVPVSAGFVSSDNKCHGRSETLGLDSREQEDTALLMMQ